MKNTERKQSLWTKDFLRITVASIISMIGGEAMSLPLSLLVFDETGSTMLSAFIIVCGMLPDVFLSVTVSPIIDRTSKKNWIVGLDICFVLVYAVMAYYTLRHPFRYAVYVVFELVTSTLSVFYRLAYDAWYPDLIPRGMEQKGFAVSGMVTDATSMIMAPVSALLYTLIPIGYIFLFVATTIVCAILIEAQITETKRTMIKTGENALKQYLSDLKEGFRYLQKEQGVRNIYSYMSISIGIGDGWMVLARAYYQTAPHLNVTMFGFATSAATAARVLSGIFLYRKEIPVRHRFFVVRIVYTALNVLSAVLLFLPFPLILVDEAIQGALGNMSYTLRETATKSYIPAHMRARLGAIFNMMICISGILFTLFAGWLGEVMSLREGIVLICVMDMTAMCLLIHLPGAKTRVVYEAVRKTKYEDL